jgi:putative transposase
VTEHPTAEWAAKQLMQAFPWDTAPSYILRDRDRVYGKTFRALAADMQITEVLTAARSPWQNPYVERLIGSFVMDNKRTVLLRIPLCGVPMQRV